MKTSRYPVKLTQREEKLLNIMSNLLILWYNPVSRHYRHFSCPTKLSEVHSLAKVNGSQIVECAHAQMALLVSVRGENNYSPINALPRRTQNYCVPPYSAAWGFLFYKYCTLVCVCVFFNRSRKNCSILNSKPWLRRDVNGIYFHAIFLMHALVVSDSKAGESLYTSVPDWHIIFLRGQCNNIIT